MKAISPREAGESSPESRHTAPRRKAGNKPRRPVAVVPAVPDGGVVGHYHRVGDAVFPQEIFHARGAGLVRKFRGVQ